MADKKISGWYVLILYFLPLWFVVAPVGMIVSILCLPFKILRRMYYGRPKNNAMEVRISECTGKGKGKDELLFVHGWPDSGDMWNKEVAYLRSEYRCIVVTLPNFSNGGRDAAAAGNWGYGFEQIV